MEADRYADEIVCMRSAFSVFADEACRSVDVRFLRRKIMRKASRIYLVFSGRSDLFDSMRRAEEMMLQAARGTGGEILDKCMICRIMIAKWRFLGQFDILQCSC